PAQKPRGEHSSTFSGGLWLVPGAWGTVIRTSVAPSFASFDMGLCPCSVKRPTRPKSLAERKRRTYASPRRSLLATSRRAFLRSERRVGPYAGSRRNGRPARARARRG